MGYRPLTRHFRITCIIPEPAPVPPSARLGPLLCGALSALLALGAGAALVLALLNSPKPAWFVAAFEAVVIFAAVFGVIEGLVRRRAGGLAFALVALAALVASGIEAIWLKELIANMGTRPAVAGRAAIALLIALLAAWMVLSRAPQRSYRLFIPGAVCAAALIAVCMLAWKQRTAMASMGGVASLAVAVLGFLVITSLAAASVHLILRAFQVADDASRTDAA